MNPTTIRYKHSRSLTRRATHFACVAVVIFCAVVVQAQEPAPKTKPTEPAKTQKIVEQGIAIEFDMEPLAKDATRVKAGEDTQVRFRVTDTTTGTPIKGLGLSAWMSQRAGDKPLDSQQCRSQIQSFMTGSLRARPDVDLNSYYVLALNRSPDISVIDPLLGFGGSKLLTLVMMKSPGEDWILTRDGERLFVTLPAINQVAVIDTRSWVVVDYIDVGPRPTSVSLQPDQKYLWVANDDNTEAGGVTVIDTGTHKVAAQISTGAGGHQTVVTADNRYAFVANRDSGTVSIIDVRTLLKINDVKVGPNLSSLALSELSKAVYVTSETEGNITVIDEQGKILARMKAKPGLRSIRFAPGGRYGFVINTKESLVNIFDAASNSVIHEPRIGKSPDQVTFSDTFAFVRSLDTEIVYMIRLGTIATEVDVNEFPGGQVPAGKAAPTLRADSIVLAPEGNAVIVANPLDKVLYYYTEGMAAPMGNFQNYRRLPMAVLIVDRSLREQTPGVYSTTIKLPASGTYNVAFLADSPRVAHCFEATADPNPLLKEARRVPLRLEHQLTELKLPVGRNFQFRFKLIETATNEPKQDLKDVRVLTFLTPGTWQRRDIAKSIGDGIYEINLNVPEAGVYMLFFESGSMGVRYTDLPHLMLHAIDEKAAPSKPAN